jgi:hypothetical protein
MSNKHSAQGPASVLEHDADSALKQHQGAKVLDVYGTVIGKGKALSAEKIKDSVLDVLR